MTQEMERHTSTADDAKSAQGELGEGNYKAGREFQQDQQAFAKDKQKVEEGAKKAAEALDGPEAEELERARAETAKGAGTRSNA